MKFNLDKGQNKVSRKRNIITEMPSNPPPLKKGADVYPAKSL